MFAVVHFSVVLVFSSFKSFPYSSTFTAAVFKNIDITTNIKVVNYISLAAVCHRALSAPFKGFRHRINRIVRDAHHFNKTQNHTALLLTIVTAVNTVPLLSLLTNGTSQKTFNI